jgi:hypothetical protein
MRRIMARPPLRRLILVQGEAMARAMRVRMTVVVVGGIGKDAIIAATINRCQSDNAAIGAAGSILPLLLLTTTTIAAVNDRHIRCHQSKTATARSQRLLFAIKGGNGGHC